MLVARFVPMSGLTIRGRTEMRSITMALMLALTVSLPGMAADGGESAFERITGHYETIRLSLVRDSVDGVAAEAEAIGRIAESLRAGFEPVEAGILDQRQAELEHLLPSLEAGAIAVSDAEGIDAVRARFAELSKSLVAYRQMTPDPEPVVVFCPMAQKVWLQPEGEIGNPYHGQSMVRCGEVVSE